LASPSKFQLYLLGLLATTTGNACTYDVANQGRCPYRVRSKESDIQRVVFTIQVCRTAPFFPPKCMRGHHYSLELVRLSEKPWLKVSTVRWFVVK
jgi:hypothetical protein